MKQRLIGALALVFVPIAAYAVSVFHVPSKTYLPSVDSKKELQKRGWQQGDVRVNPDVSAVYDTVAQRPLVPYRYWDTVPGQDWAEIEPMDASERAAVDSATFDALNAKYAALQVRVLGRAGNAVLATVGPLGDERLVIRWADGSQEVLKRQGQ